jgi:DNA-directed RNA polymerase sigma subunit (sigma70/sigma32)
MKKISDTLARFLGLMGSNSFLVTDNDKANIDILLTMLGEVDKDILSSEFGILGAPRETRDALARRYGVKAEAIDEIIEKDLRKLAITPEWQMMEQQFSPLVRSRLGLDSK